MRDAAPNIFPLPEFMYVWAPRIAGRDVHHRADLILRRRDGICWCGAEGVELCMGHGTGGSATYHWKPMDLLSQIEYSLMSVASQRAKDAHKYTIHFRCENPCRPSPPKNS